LGQSIHAFLNLDVDLSVLRQLVQSVLVDCFLRELFQIDYHIFESSKGGVHIEFFDVNDHELGACGRNDTVDNIFFSVVSPAVLVDLSPGYSIWSPPTVNCVLSLSSLWSLISTMNDPYMTFRPFGMLDRRMNLIVFASYNLLISLAVELIHLIL
jgi:hypothetical protein